MSVRLKLAVAAGAVSLFALVQVLSASASAGSRPAAQSVIVVFKNQDRAQPATRSGLGARRRTLARIQRPVLRRLAERQCSQRPQLHHAQRRFGDSVAGAAVVAEV